MKKYAIIGIATAAVIAAGGVGYAAVKGDCGYDEKGYFHKDGKVYAMGTMNDARACAVNGLLPQAVLDRLGRWGSKDEAQEIKDLDAKVKAEKEAAAKAAEEAAKAKALEVK